MSGAGIDGTEINIGGLYKLSDGDLIVYASLSELDRASFVGFPLRDKSVLGIRQSVKCVVSANSKPNVLKYWSTGYDCKLQIGKANIYFLVVDKKVIKGLGSCFLVLFPVVLGWIYCPARVKDRLTK